MYEEPRRRQRNWPAMFIVLGIIGFASAAVWWMESRFSAGFAMAVVASLVGALSFAAGALINHASTRSTLGSAADFNRSLAMTEKARQMTYREGARLERDAFNARARLLAIDERRVDQLAQQRARLLTDNEQARIDAERREQNLAWAMDDDGDAGDGIREW